MVKKRKTELDIDTSFQIETPEVEVEEAEAPPPPLEEPVEEASPEETEETEKKPSRRNIYIIAGLAVAVIALAGITYSVIFGGSLPEETVTEKETMDETTIEDETAAPETVVPLIPLHNITLEPFILPIGDGEGGGFFQIRFTLELSNEDAVAEVEENLSILRESIFVFLKRHKVEDFTKPSKRKDTILSLTRQLDRSLQNGRVNAVLVTELKIL